QKCVQLFTYTFDLFRVHIDSPYKHHAHKKLSALLPLFLELNSRCSVNSGILETSGQADT
ncbi:MAG: hypothetical protein ABIG61_07150, partial [Planctomycetota bacterium]